MSILHGSVSVTLDRAHLQARMERGKDLAGAAVAEAVLNDSRPYTPHDQGTLEDSGRVEKVDDDYAVTWNTVYAAYQWYGCYPDGSHVIRNHDRSINAKATTQWAIEARKQYGESWQKIADKKMKEGSG